MFSREQSALKALGRWERWGGWGLGVRGFTDREVGGQAGFLDGNLAWEVI